MPPRSPRGTSPCRRCWRDRRAEPTNGNRSVPRDRAQWGCGVNAPVIWLAVAGAIGLAPLPSAAVHRVRALRTPVAATAVGPRLPRRMEPLIASLSAAALLAGIAVAALIGPVLGLAAVTAGGTGAWLTRAAMASRTVARRERELRSALHLVAAELAVGSAPSQALESAVEIAPAYRSAFDEAAAALRRGDRVEFGDGDLKPLAHAWAVATVTGAPLAEVVTRVADDVAARAEARRAVTGAVAGARSSAALLAGLPALGLALGAGMQAHPLAVLLGSPYGRLLCLLGVALDCAGLIWTERLAARAIRVR